jgi:hypothetical protein
MGLVHVLHASRCVTLFHGGLGHVEVRRRLLLLGGVGHLGDHVIHLFHMSIVAEVLGAGERGRKGNGGNKRRCDKLREDGIAPA